MNEDGLANLKKEDRSAVFGAGSLSRVRGISLLKMSSLKTSSSPSAMTVTSCCSGEEASRPVSFELGAAEISWMSSKIVETASKIFIL